MCACFIIAFNAIWDGTKDLRSDKSRCINFPIMYFVEFRND